MSIEDTYSPEHVQHCYEVVIWDLERRGLQLRAAISGMKTLIDAEVLFSANASDGAEPSASGSERSGRE
jgi:hypothetical protein